MPTATTINSIATEDKDPTAAPYRISGQPGKDHADFTFTPTHDGTYLPCSQLVPPFTPGVPASIIAVIVRDGGVDPYTGIEVGRKGLVCSDSEPCSSSLSCSDWQSPSGVQLSEDVTYAEEGASPTDGSHTISVWVCTDRQGWS